MRHFANPVAAASMMAPHATIYSGYGADAPAEVTMPVQVNPYWAALSTASMAVSAYHGYRRNSRGDHPVAWALGWGLLGAMFPVIVPVIAFAEGFGEPE